jgi:hypothetical protein
MVLILNIALECSSGVVHRVVDTNSDSVLENKPTGKIQFLGHGCPLS